MKYQLTDWDVETIHDVLDYNDLGTLRGYSGRAMYGEECLGIVTGDVGKTCFLLGALIARIGGRGNDLLEGLQNSSIRTDSMGKDNEVVYFVGVSLPASFTDKSDEED